jgi:hypothetical protein
MRSTSETYLQQNQLMQQNSSSHVGDGNDGHNQECSQHKPLTPSLQDVCLWLAYIAPVAICILAPNEDAHFE